VNGFYFMSAQSEELKERTISFAVTVLRLIDNCPHTTTGKVIGHQLAKSATSVGANYRAACRSMSEAPAPKPMSYVRSSRARSAQPAPTCAFTQSPNPQINDPMTR